MSYIAFASYLIISIAMTIWVARALSKSGEIFLIKCFGQDEELAKSTNQLLVIGFYLINIGFICFRIDGWDGAMNGNNVVSDEAYKIRLSILVVSSVGISSLVLGAMHFFNMIMIAKFGRAVSNWMHTTTEHTRNKSLPTPQPTVEGKAVLDPLTANLPTAVPNSPWAQ
jgi:hypothetical protein